MSDLREAAEVLFLGPREWKPLFKTPKLWKVESLFWGHYLFRFAPLDIWLQARHLDRPFGDFRYGETPWSTGLKILERAELKPDETLFDLGCGRGKMVFLAHLARGADAVGIDLLGSYLYVAHRITRWLKLEGCHFLQEDFTRADISEADVVYIAGSIFETETREQLLTQVDSLSPGARWLSVTWPSEHPRLELYAQEEYLFSWGRETVFFYRVV